MTHGARRISWLAALALLAVLGSSCAYYNTFYLAKKYYTTATDGMPYAVEKVTGAQAGNYQKAIDYSKKVITNYPKSKHVDDAYLMWAKSLLGKEDPLQTVNMLLDFSPRYPNSQLKDEARFYLGVAYRQARKYREALVPLEEFVEKQPKHELAPYAHLERARALASLNRHAEAAAAAGQIVERFPGSPLVVRARAVRAEALLAGGDPQGARRDFQALGVRAADDQERFTFLLREADCLEAARDYAAELSLLSKALAQEPPPVKGPGGAAPSGQGTDRYGQLTLRVGTAHLLEGRTDQALTAYRNVIQDYPKTNLSAEAQYRIGYAYETVLDDFDLARQEYAKVRDQSVSSAFFQQATSRQQSLDRLARYRSAGGDSLDRRVEAGFLLAEQYLFELEKPDRAIEAYTEIARENAGTPAAAKALNAAGWVFKNKFARPQTADSLWWAVVRNYPATEAQLAARDYLEAGGQTVPADLIKMPATPEPAPVDTVLQLTSPPIGPMPLGSPYIIPRMQLPDSLTPVHEGVPRPDTPVAASPDSTGPKPPGMPPTSMPPIGPRPDTTGVQPNPVPAPKPDSSGTRPR